jgi:hypothetical protein
VSPETTHWLLQKLLQKVQDQSHFSIDQNTTTAKLKMQQQ